MPTFRKIATVTGNNSSTDLVFTSIPQTYTDLCVIGTIRSVNNSVANVILLKNSDTSGNSGVPYRGIYFIRADVANSGAFTVGSPMGASGFNTGYASTTDQTQNPGTINAPFIAYINNYTQSLSQVYNSNSGFTNRAVANYSAAFSGGVFNVENAVTSLNIRLNGQVFSSSTTIDLYGISNA